MNTARPSRPVSVLVVDDIADTVDTFAMVLTLHGFVVRCATSAQTALASAATDPPDVVLTDIAMPHLDGWEFIRRLREQTQPHKLFVIVVSGRGTEEDIRRSTEAGAKLHLLKPVSPIELVRILDGLSAWAGGLIAAAT